MMNRSMRIAGTITALALLAAMYGAASAADGEVDIVGLRLGMTVDEARTAIAAYNPDLVIQPPVEKVFQYRVGNEVRKTDPFIGYIFAVSGKPQKDDIYVYFSFPPGEPRVVAIQRLHNNFDPPIPRENYYRALVDKYGEPSATQKDKHGDEAHRIHWYQWHIGDGKVQCVPTSSGGRDVEGLFGAMSVYTIEGGEVLKQITDASTGALANLPEGDPSDCATLLTYQLTYDPLGSATGSLIDIAGAAKSEQDLSAWIAGLTQGDDAPPGSAPAPKL